jgi:hypothetical protein
LHSWISPRRRSQRHHKPLHWSSLWFNFFCHNPRSLVWRLLPTRLSLSNSLWRVIQSSRVNNKPGLTPLTRTFQELAQESWATLVDSRIYPCPQTSSQSWKGRNCQANKTDILGALANLTSSSPTILMSVSSNVWLVAWLRRECDPWRVAKVNVDLGQDDMIVTVEESKSIIKLPSNLCHLVLSFLPATVFTKFPFSSQVQQLL